MPLEHEELTHAILGAAVAVHRALGPGFIEAIYARALEIELSELKIPFDRELRVIVLYRGHPVGEHKLDLLVRRTIVVELKAVRSLDPVHFAIVRSYLRALGLQHGLLINFSGGTLQAKRVIAPPHSHSVSCIPAFLSGPKNDEPPDRPSSRG